MQNQEKNNTKRTKEMVLIVDTTRPQRGQASHMLKKRGVCANITVDFRGSSSQRDAVVRRSSCFLCAKVEVVRASLVSMVGNGVVEGHRPRTCACGGGKNGACNVTL